MSVHQAGVNFGVSSSLAGVNGKFQTLDHEHKSEVEHIRDGGGSTVTKVYYDFNEEATFEYVASGTDNSMTVPVTSGSVGDLLTVTDSTYGGIVGTTWLIDNVSIKGSNTTS